MYKRQALTSPLLGERRVKRGDEIITVAAGFPTTVTPAIQYGAVPVFVDVTIPQYNIDVSMLEAALSEKTKAVMLALSLIHIYLKRTFEKAQPELVLHLAAQPIVRDSYKDPVYTLSLIHIWIGAGWFTAMMVFMFSLNKWEMLYNLSLIHI